MRKMIRGYRQELETISWELKPMGVVWCAAMGLAAEIFSFFFLEIRVAEAPAIVIIFLWLLFSMLFSGFLFALSDFVYCSQADR